MSITNVPIRAYIDFGSLTIETPFILSFNVTKTRNSKSTFSASLKILSTELNSLSSNEVTIRAGTVTDQQTIFTGFVLSTRPSICFDDPNYTILNVSGSDVLYKLEGQKYTRRQISSKTKWASIESVTRSAAKGGSFRLINAPVQLIEEDIVGTTEKDDKNKLAADLVSIAQNTLPGQDKVIFFNYGPVTYTEVA